VRNKTWKTFFKMLLPVVVIAGVLFPVQTAADMGEVRVIDVDSNINPGVALFVERALREAEKADATCLVIQLDTPGGLVDAMRSIVKVMLDSRTPVVVYVAPGGARAASAGVMITIAAHVAAMAPGTNIGAAHPVALGSKMEDTMSEKITNDLVAYVRSLAKQRNRNEDWVEKAVRESVSITAEEAVKAQVVDLVAGSLAELLDKIHGREVDVNGKVVQIESRGASIVFVREKMRERVLRTIANPNIAYILMMIGLLGLYFELSSPGALFPGIIGAICLILAFFAFQTLPVNYAGILLIILGILLFILEIKVTSMGLLSIGGTVCLVLGSLFLFKGDDMGLVRVSWEVIIPTVTVVVLFLTVVVGLVVKAQLRRPATGVSGLIGEFGEVTGVDLPKGIKVFVHGELWNALSDEELKAGDRVEVIGLDGFRVRVKRVE